MVEAANSSAAEEHGDWLIWHAPLPIEWRGADWHYARKNARDECDIGDAESREMCIQSIDYIEQSEAEDATPEGRERLDRISEKAMQLLAAHHVRKALKNLLDLPGISNLPGFATGVHIASAQWALATFDERYGIVNASTLRSTKDQGNG